MIVIWDVLAGSGVEDIIALIYKAAAHAATMKVQSFNYSLRCCKLIYTAMSMLFLESFFKSNSSSIIATVKDQLKDIFKSIPSDFAVERINQDWFKEFLNTIQSTALPELIDEWSKEQCQSNEAFRFWYFIYRQLLEPLIKFYMSIRLSNFQGRITLALNQYLHLLF